MMSSATPIVFVVDGDPAVRASLASAVSGAGWRPETFASRDEFVSRQRALVPSCLVLELTAADRGGIDLLKHVAAERMDMPTIVITAYSDVPTTVQAMKAGAVELLTKPFNEEVMLSAVGHAIARSRMTLGREAALQALRESYASLSPREREVMELVVGGLLNKRVGGQLGISEVTVKAHRGQVMRKMKADSLAALVQMATMLRLATTPAYLFLPGPWVANRRWST
jgi:FixJ family two-component response regulator